MALALRTTDEIDTVTDAELVADGDKNTSYKYRHLTLPKNREIVKRNTKKRRRENEDPVDWAAVSDDQLDFVLISWDGVEVNGKAVAINDVIGDTAAKYLLDGVRRQALLERAGINEVQAAQERRSESFQPTPVVR